MLKFGSTLLTLLCAAAVIMFVMAGGCEKFSGDPALNQAADLMRANRLDAAAEALNVYLREHPGDPSAITLHFLLLAKTEQLDAATDTLSRISSPDKLVARALTDRDPVIRVGAARLVSERHVPVSSASLIHGLNDASPRVREGCAAALGQRREQAALKPLFELLADDNLAVRGKAAEAIGALGDPRAAGWLLQMVDAEGATALSASAALRQVTQEANHEYLARMCRQSRPPKRIIIAIALAKLRDPIALEVLTSAEPVPSVSLRVRIAEALGDYPEAQVTEALHRLASDPDSQVREKALDSLMRVSTRGAGA